MPSSVNIASVKAPARLGSSARRRGALARIQRVTTTITTMAQSAAIMARCTRSITQATSASGQVRSR